ncbi:MAG: glycosyltransferase family 2 protein [Planctomycetes bacterium]|nr:glycosyltransferase family 2 protein [Planctomycetota bacterium]
MVSIIIPTCNRAAILARSLPAVLAMRGADRCEVLVVDDGSGDDTPQVLAGLARRHPNLIVLRQDNAGPGPARNLGLRHAGRDRVLFLDDDIFPDPSLLSAHRERLDAGADVSQGDMVWHEDIAADSIIRYMDEHGMQFRLAGRADGEPLPYHAVYTANLALATADARAAGGFDAAFARQRYAFEDTAFAWRLAEAGKRIVFTPRARARHLHPMTETALLRREYAVGYGLAVARRQYPEMAANLGFARAARGRGWLPPLLALLERTGIARLAGPDGRRRLALKREFLRGLAEGLRGREDPHEG